MSLTSPTLHLLCGLAGSGKSTLATHLGQAPNTIVLSEDKWLFALLGDQMETLADYVACAGKLRSVIAPHCLDLLAAGVSVVLDFPANTPQSRVWLRDLAERSGVNHVMHVLEVPEDVARVRVAARNVEGAHPFTVSEAQFNLLLTHYRPPAADEGFRLKRHSA